MIDGVFRRNFKLQNLKFRNGILHFRMSPLYLLVHLLVSILFFQIFMSSLWCIACSPAIYFCGDLQYGSFSRAEPKLVINYLQSLKSSEEALREQVFFSFFLIFGWCFSLFFLLYLSMTSMFVVSSADTHVFLLTVGKGKEKRSSLYCHICKKRAGDSWAEGNDLFFPFSFLMWIFCRLLEFKVTF